MQLRHPLTSVPPPPPLHIQLKRHIRMMLAQEVQQVYQHQRHQSLFNFRSVFPSMLYSFGLLGITGCLGV